METLIAVLQQGGKHSLHLPWRKSQASNYIPPKTSSIIQKQSACQLW